MLDFLTETKRIQAMSSITEFWETARHECERADRYGMRLSMAVYEIGINDENNILVRRLVRTLFNRVRNMDNIGWFDTGQIGILLPHTPNDGAFKLAQDVYYLMMSPIASLPPFTIFTYPSEIWPVKPGRGRLQLARLTSFFKTLFNPNTITSSEELRAHLKLELDRATRYGHIFSLLIFNAGEAPASRAGLKKIAKALNSRLRETDEFGRYGDDQIAAIMPYATHHKAKAIGEEICRMAAVNPAAGLTIYTYPTNWFAEVKNKSGHDRQQAVGVENRQSNNRAVTHGLRASEVDNFIARPMPLWKRGMDIFGALVGVVLFMPFFTLAVVGIKLTSPGPIFFRQERVGYKQQMFPLIKFRTMHADSDAESHRKFMKDLISKNGGRPDTKLAQDPRIFAFGRFLRRASIDEMPQLINVLKGEMSLVGPRPCLAYEAEEYLRWHTKRFNIMPGLTGLWQVSGKNRLSFKQMIRLDIQYEKKFSFWLDLKILLKTPLAVISIFLEKQT